MSKHTPGPWKFGGLSNDILHGSYTVATMPSEYEDNAVDQWGSPEKALKGIAADARLIAAAPDLLAALQLVLVADSISPGDCYNPDGSPNKLWGSIDEAKAAARAAIAKATGGDL